MKILPCFLTTCPTAGTEDDDEDDPYQQQEEEEEELANQSPADRLRTFTPPDSSVMGQRVLAVVVIILAVVIALPTVLILLFKPPPPLQDVHVFGLSYYKLVSLFNLSAVMLLVSTIIFLKARLPVITATFIISLFCSLPLIIGLRQDLTMQQAILGIAVFAGWPFFIRPLYLLSTLVLPTGALLFFALQIRTLFSRQPHSYAYGGAALFLAVATLIGTHELSRAGQPTIAAIFHGRQAPESVVAANEPQQSRPEAEGPFPPAPTTAATPGQPPLTDRPVTDAPSADATQTAGEHAGPQATIPADAVVAKAPATMDDSVAMEGIAQKLASVIGALDTKLNDLTLVQAKSEEQRHKSEEQRQRELSALDQRVEALSGKLDAILLQMETRPRQVQQSQPPATAAPTTTAGVTSAMPQSGEGAPEAGKALSTVNRQIDALMEKVKAIETKAHDGP